MIDENTSKVVNTLQCAYRPIYLYVSESRSATNTVSDVLQTNRCALFVCDFLLYVIINRKPCSSYQIILFLSKMDFITLDERQRFRSDKLWPTMETTITAVPALLTLSEILYYPCNLSSAVHPPSPSMLFCDILSP